jgi:dTMP kinase
MSVLIAFEGGEGSGKSTQARLLAERLGAVLTHEPGGTALGRRIRDLVLDPSLSGVAARAEALLMAADRAQHVAEVIRPALERGRDVVTDRFAGSTLAYQGFGRGLSVEELRGLSAWAAAGLEPDVVLLLDVPADVAAQRRSGAADRMESEDHTFHARVMEGYRSLAATERPRWIVVDGNGPIDEVAARVWSALTAKVARFAGLRAAQRSNFPGP